MHLNFKPCHSSSHYFLSWNKWSRQTSDWICHPNWNHGKYEWWCNSNCCYSCLYYEQSAWRFSRFWSVSRMLVRNCFGCFLENFGYHWFTWQLNIYMRWYLMIQLIVNVVYLYLFVFCNFFLHKTRLPDVLYAPWYLKGIKRVVATGVALGIPRHRG